jgi:hypothetical protein
MLEPSSGTKKTWSILILKQLNSVQVYVFEWESAKDGFDT